MRVILTLILVFSTLWVASQTPPAHTYFNTPLLLEDGDDLIDSTDHSIADTVADMFLFGHETGNWYRIVGDEHEYTYLTWDIIETDRGFPTYSVELRDGEIVSIDGWRSRSILKLTPGLMLQYYMARFTTAGDIKYRITRQDYQPTNPIDEINNAQRFEVNDCIDVSTYLATPSDASQNFNQSPENSDVFYKFRATSDVVFHSSTLNYVRYEIFTDLTQPDFQKIRWEQNDLGYKYTLELDSTYYIRFVNSNPFDESIEHFCLEVYDSEIHDEEGNFICENARNITFDGAGALMFIDTFASSQSIIKDCSGPQVPMGQWYHLDERDTTINYTIYIDTNVVKLHIFSGTCRTLNCFDNFYQEWRNGFLK